METLLYFVFWAALIFLMMRVGCGAHVMGHGHRRRDEPGSGAPQRPDDLRWVPPEADVDPVCGKTVQTGTAKPSVHEGMVYYFCSRECRERFEVAPKLYVGPKTHQQPKQKEHTHG